MPVYAVGVGPGSPGCLTREAERIISGCDVVIGYEYTLDTIRGLIGGKKVVTVTMADQEAAYQEAAGTLGDGSLVVPFTGDASFSESEVVDRLAEIFGRVQVVPGISSVQVAAARTAVPLDKAAVITFHVTGDIEGKKEELVRALESGRSAIVVPRPWPKRPELEFMPSEMARYLAGRGIDTASLRAHVFEALTTDAEAHFAGTAAELEGKEFSPLSVVVLDQRSPDSYVNYRWQWEGVKSPEG